LKLGALRNPAITSNQVRDIVGRQGCARGQEGQARSGSLPGLQPCGADGWMGWNALQCDRRVSDPLCRRPLCLRVGEQELFGYCIAVDSKACHAFLCEHLLRRTLIHKHAVSTSHACRAIDFVCSALAVDSVSKLVRSHMPAVLSSAPPTRKTTLLPRAYTHAPIHRALTRSLGGGQVGLSTASLRVHLRAKHPHVPLPPSPFVKIH
jgi:hypothetical protein